MGTDLCHHKLEFMSPCVRIELISSTHGTALLGEQQSLIFYKNHSTTILTFFQDLEHSEGFHSTTILTGPPLTIPIPKKKKNHSTTILTFFQDLEHSEAFHSTTILTGPPL